MQGTSATLGCFLSCLLSIGRPMVLYFIVIVDFIVVTLIVIRKNLELAETAVLQLSKIFSFQPNDESLHLHCFLCLF